MKKVLLSYGSFSQEYVAKILAAVPPGWHVIRTTKETDLRRLAPDILFVLSGSKADQKRQAVAIRFVGGCRKGTFIVSLGSLTGFFQQFETGSVDETKSDEEHGVPSS
jgi:hypothetical protein